MAHKLGLLVLVFLVGFLTACGQNEAVEEVVLVTVTAVSPTSLSLTITPSATATTIPTQTPTATATAIPTLTPLPTFAPEELETAVADLLANPMNCDVPCWWGAIPGKTTTFEIEQSLAPYKFAEYPYETQQINGITFLFDRIINEEFIYFPVTYTFENHILETIYTGKAPPLNKILKNYGQPDEIWLSVLGSRGDKFSPVWLNLIYFKENMAIGYIGDGTISNDELTGCFSNTTSNTTMESIRINSSNTEIIDENFTSIYFTSPLHLSLEKATNLTIEEFMQKFSDPNQPKCLETPIELWD